MEALYFFKFWKPNPSQKGEDSHPFSSTGPIKPGGGDQLEDEDDSFFELELISSSSRLEFDPNKKAGPFHEPSSDSIISKRKVLPIEPGSKPQSPISLLKSAPSLKVLTFKKSKSTARHDSSEDEEEWKLGKYLKLIYRPLNARKEKKVTTMGMMGSPSPSSSPLTVDSSPGKERTASTGGGRIRVACKKLGKSRSSPVGAGAAPAGRRDDSLVLHHDGIQGAILHCKKSFNSSRDPSLLSRFACEEYSQFRESPRSSSDVN